MLAIVPAADITPAPFPENLDTANSAYNCPSSVIEDRELYSNTTNLSKVITQVTDLLWGIDFSNIFS